MQRHIILFILVLSSLLSPNFALSKARYQRAENGNLVYYTQIQLKAKQFYNEEPSGVCDTKTRKAILAYLVYRRKQLAGNICEARSLESFNRTLSDDTTGIAPPTEPVALDISDTNKESEIVDRLSRQIDEYKSDINKYAAASKDLDEKFMTRLHENFSNVVSLGVGAYTTLLAIIVTVGIFFIQIYLNAGIHRALEKELQLTASKISEISNISRYELSIDLLSQISFPFFYLYRDIPHPETNRKLIDSYVTVALAMAKRAYNYALQLKESVIRSGAYLSPAQEKLIDLSINNYAFYLAERKNTDDIDILIGILPILEKVALAWRTKNEEGWWSFIETVAWANLNLGRATAQQTGETVQSLIDDYSISQKWKVEIKERYDFHNKRIYPLPCQGAQSLNPCAHGSH
jgi:hypothetical protein